MAILLTVPPGSNGAWHAPDPQDHPAQNRIHEPVESAARVAPQSRDDPEIQREAVFIGTVERGTMLRQVRGLGTLVPEQSLMLYAATDARVAGIHVLPGAEVKADTIVMTLSNPELQQSLKDAEFQLRAAEAELLLLESQIEGERWQQEAALDALKAELAQAQRADQKTPSVPDKETAPRSAARPAHSRVEELARRYEIEERFLKANAASARARLRQREIQLERAHSLLEFKRRQVAGLIVRAGMDGTVLRIGGTERLQEGQAVTPDTVLATILQPAQLRAELAIPDSHSGEIQVGQPALIETHAGKVPGRVAGIDPAVAAATGTVTVYTDLDSRSILTIALTGDQRLASRLADLELLPIEGPHNGRFDFLGLSLAGSSAGKANRT